MRHGFVLRLWLGVTVAVFSGGAPPVGAAEAGDEVLIAAGEIHANCRADGGDEATASLVDDVAGTIATLGDNAGGSGSSAEYNDCYGPAWGRHRPRTRPTPGNHDYVTPDAGGYFAYFGSAAGDPRQGYYSYDLGAWHVLALNSNCRQAGGCDADSPQANWLRADLAQAASRGVTCLAAYWHHPRFVSSTAGPDAPAAPSSDVKMTAVWRILQTAGVDVVLSGHRGVYERFARLDADGVPTPTGIRQFVIGTAGKSPDVFRGGVAANSEARTDQVQAVLKLTLRTTGYDWEFTTVPGQPRSSFRDSGSDTCTPT